MGDLKQSINFIGSGLNSDDADIVKGSGDSIYRLNVMVGEDGYNGVITNLKGNRQIVYPEPLTLSNTYACVGSFYNALTRRAYYFICSQPYDSGGGVYMYDNRLLSFVEDTEQIETIFRDTKNYLGLNPYSLLTDIRMIESWLFYNNRIDEPRMIDVTMAYNYTFYPTYDDTDPSFSAVAGDTYTYKGGLFRANQSVSAGEDPVNSATKWDRIGDSYMDESTVEGSDFYRAFLAIKTPPTDRIRAAFKSDPSSSFNNVSGKVFRFTHRYQYFDDSYSAFSAHSNITLPIDTELYNGEIVNNGVVNNYIELNFSLFSPALVKNVEVYFQELDGDWKRLAVVHRQQQTLLDTVAYTLDFFNNEGYPALADGLADIIYDAVPKVASAQEIINKNVLTYGGCTEGFNNIDRDQLDITLTPQIKAMPTGVYYEGTVRRDNISNNDISYSSELDESYPGGGQWIYYADMDVSAWFAGAGVSNGDVYKVTLNGFTGYKTLGASDVDTAAHLAEAIASTIRELGFSCNVINTDTARVDTMYSAVYFNLSTIYDTPSVINPDYNSLTKLTGFKQASYHPFCIFYYDDPLRRGDAQLNEDTVVYVPSINEYSPPVTSTAYRWLINWSVNHEPPSWARYWKWGYAGNRRCSYFIQYIVSEVKDGSYAVNNSVEVDITPLQTIKTTTTSQWNCYPNSNISPYSYSKGDRIRFVTVATNPATPSTLLGATVDGVYDFEIIKFDEEKNKLYVQDFDYSAAGFGINTLVEIYTPKITAPTELYYEFGDMMPIAIDANGNRVHAGITQNQVIGSGAKAATGTFSSGDVYHIMRTPSKPLCTNAGEETNGAYHESMWWSDFYNSDDWDRGKVGIENPVGEQTLNIIRYSNVYLQNTDVNGITTFPVNNFKELNDTYGNIVAMVEVGDTLKVYQEKKSCSVGIGRTEYMDANGKITVVGSDQVLGVVRYSPTNYGTTFPESVCRNNRYVYGFDAYQGVVWRDTPNGIHPISGRYEELGSARDYKMSHYFKDKAKALLTSGVSHCNVFTVWDERYAMLYVVFKDLVDKTNDETIIFHEPSDRWITFTQFSYTPANGFNEMLELSWNVVRGFDLGLNHYFDEETRFEVFDIETGVNDFFFAEQDSITITSYDPTWHTDSNPTLDKDDLKLTSYDPTYVVSYVDLTVTSHTWAAGEDGSGNSVESYLTGNPSPLIITAIPSWMNVASKTQPLNPYSIGDTVATGTYLVFYPNTENEGALRSGSVTFADSNSGYLDTKSFVATQSAPIIPPTVGVYVDGDNPSDITITAMSGSMNPGETDINITFTPNHHDYTSGQTIQMYWRAEVDGGYSTVSKLFSATDEVVNNVTVTMPYVVNTGSTVNVFLKGVASGDTISAVGLDTITITSYNPSYITSACLADVTGFSFAYNEDSYAEGQTTTITASGAPPDPTMNVTIISKPTWCVIWHGDNITGYALYEGQTIADQETITVFPISSNTEYIGRSGSIVLRSSYGDTVTLTVAQSEYTPPATTPIVVTLDIHSNSESYLTLPIGYYNSSAVSGGTLVNYSFIIRNSLCSDGESFTLYWRADRTTSGVTSTDATGSFEAINTVDETVETHSNSGYLNIASTLIAGDTLTLYFSIYSF